MYLRLQTFKQQGEAQKITKDQKKAFFVFIAFMLLSVCSRIAFSALWLNLVDV